MKSCPTCGHPVEEFCGVRIDREQRLVRLGDGVAVLTKNQMAVFVMLFEARGRLVRKDAIFARLYHHRPECEWPQDPITNKFVSDLRRRLRPLGIDVARLYGEGAFRLALASP